MKIKFFHLKFHTGKMKKFYEKSSSNKDKINKNNMA